MVNTYKDLVVWQKSMDLVEKVYVVTRKFPTEELYSLTNQIRRAAISIPSNIAEGYNRNTTKEYLSFLYVARGSAAEVETQLMLGNRLGYLSEDDLLGLMEIRDQVAKMINGIINKLK